MVKYYLKIAFYFIVSIIAIQKLQSEIIYYDIKPDATISATTDEIFKRIEFDLDGDGSVDFYFKHFNFDAFEIEVEAYTYPGRKAEFLVDNQYRPLSLDMDFLISGISGNWFNTSPGGSSSSAIFMKDNWAGKGEKYIGLRFDVNNVWHYAWMRMLVPDDAGNFTIMDFAYESEPEKQILAGDKGSTGIINSDFSFEYRITNEHLFINDISRNLNLKLEIFNISGSKVISQSYKNPEIMVDISKLPSSIYFAIITQGIIKKNLKFIKFQK